MASITLLGVEFQVTYTVQAMKDVEKEFGKDWADADERLPSTIFILYKLMKAATRREKLRCDLFHEEYKGPEVPDFETLQEIMTPEDIRNAADAIQTALAEAGKVSLETRPDPKKNEAIE